MSMPDKCIWCGLHDIRNIDGEMYFACGSSCYDSSGVWEQSTGCAEILQARKRIAKAIEAAQVQARWPSGEFDEIVEGRALDLMVEILEGKQ